MSVSLLFVRQFVVCPTLVSLLFVRQFVVCLSVMVLPSVTNTSIVRSTLVAKVVRPNVLMTLHTMTRSHDLLFCEIKSREGAGVAWQPCVQR